MVYASVAAFSFFSFVIRTRALQNSAVGSQRQAAVARYDAEEALYGEGINEPVLGQSQIECNSDSDCPMEQDTNFRCMQKAGLALTEKNRCRLTGMSPKNAIQACMCATMKCPGAIHEEPAKYPDKLQFLYIGDCVLHMAKDRFRGFLIGQGWEVAKALGNAGSANRAVHCLDGWLQTEKDRRWDVIAFNFGLHDVAHSTEHLSLQEYTRHLARIVEKLAALQRRYGTKLLFATTTPAPNVPVIDGADCTTPDTGLKCLVPPRYNTDIAAYNAAASQIMQAARDNGTQVMELDLYSHVNKLCGGEGYSTCEYQQPYNVHFTAAGYDSIAEQYKQAFLKLVR